MSAIGVASRKVGAFRRVPVERVTSSDRAPRDRFSFFFSLLVSIYLGAVIGTLVWGWSYYTTPIPERYLHPNFPLLKSAGPVGLLLGIAGTAMMLISLLYVVSKRWKFLSRITTPARWLQIHIFFGFAGPILVTLHTGGKLGGLVSIAFFAMWSMVLSGIVGRYIYSKLPRTIKGTEMTLKEVEAQLQEMVAAVKSNPKGETVLPRVNALLAGTRVARGSLLGAVLRLVREDLELPFTAFRIFWIVGKLRLPAGRRLEITRLVLRQQRVLARLAVYDHTKQLFSYWHVFHRPFIVVTMVLVFLHVGTALYFGYGLSW